MIPTASVKVAPRWRPDKSILRMGQLPPKVMSRKVSSIIRRAITIINTAVCIVPSIVASTALAQSPPDTLSPTRYVIRAAHLIDGRSAAPRDNIAVLVEGERIVAVGSVAEVTARAT